MMDVQSIRPSGDHSREVRALGSLMPFLWPKGEVELRVRVVIAIVFLAAAKVATVYIPIFYKDAVDALSGETGAGSTADLAVALPLGAILAYGAARVLSLAFAELRDAVFAKVAQRAIRSVALTVFRHLHGLALRFHLERQTGGLSRVIERGTKAIESLLAFTLFNILPTLIEIVLVAAILWSLFNIWFALVTLATVGAYIGFTMWVTDWRLKFRRRMNATDQEANTKAIDSLLNFETVKYFGNEAHEAGRYDSAMRQYERAAVHSKASLSLLNIGQALIISVGLTIVMIMAADGIVAGTMTIGDFVLVNTYLIQLYQPLNVFGWVYREIKQGLVDMELMFQLLDVPAEVADKPGAPALEMRGGAIAFDDVGFGYDPRRPILKGVSFAVELGRTVAIVGATGAGKSTISRLLFRFYDVDAGAVRIDGQDVRDVTQESLRAAIGIVPQDTVLFNDTVYYNIAYGRPSASPAEIERAARLAHIHDFVMGLPDGYQTRVGERGLKLSGGEKQRVAIARTILKDPEILVFDEATSALDTHTEREIQANLREVSQGRTALVIAHRLSTVIDADEIIVLDQGRIVERGHHLELLAANGTYAALWHRQQDVKAPSDPPPEPIAG
ncbi:MAG: ATP-binding cassette domain-containing protein [Alphaproteobacteria bacterium]|jgi:ATP-binding cassette subfamily B protein|nr:ATP-binding cassette domain-containing protein [Alphaproteobacteria bacterium]